MKYSKNQILDRIYTFPVGCIPESREELLAKVAIILFIAEKELPQIDPEIIKKELISTLDVKAEVELPSIGEAQRTLFIVPGYIQDYNRLQLLKEKDLRYIVLFEVLEHNILINNQINKATSNTR